MNIASNITPLGLRARLLVAQVLARLRRRQPEPQAHIVALSGAVMIFTPTGNVVLTPSAARAVARELPALANLSDENLFRAISPE